MPWNRITNNLRLVTLLISSGGVFLTGLSIVAVLVFYLKYNPGREELVELVTAVGALSLILALLIALLVLKSLKPVSQLAVHVKESNESLREELQVRLLTEEKLKHSEARTRAILSAAIDSIVSVDAEGKITEFNPAAEKTFGYSREEVIGKPMVEYLIPPSERIKHQDGFLHLLGRLIELMAMRANGDSFPVEMFTVRVPGEPITFTSFIRDITERKNAERNLLKQMGVTQRINEELKQFAYVASHDLQEPLRMVASFTQLLARRYKGRLDAEADAFIQHAVDGAKRMQDLIKSLLDYSRAGRDDIPLGPIDPSEALRAAIENLKASIEESDAEITSGPLPVVVSDKIQLTQLFQNLIGNAIKYRGEQRPKIHIYATQDFGGWTFGVQDNGIGMTEEDSKRIFVIFRRLHDRSKYPGSGVGLAIAKKIMDRHNGSIWVKSEPNKGSTFFFQFPEVSSVQFKHSIRKPQERPLTLL
jgi:PAS domain S-box-containing protein